MAKAAAKKATKKGKSTYNISTPPWHHSLTTTWWRCHWIGLQPHGSALNGKFLAWRLCFSQSTIHKLPSQFLISKSFSSKNFHGRFFVRGKARILKLKTIYLNFLFYLTAAPRPKVTKKVAKKATKAKSPAKKAAKKTTKKATKKTTKKWSGLTY